QAPHDKPMTFERFEPASLEAAKLAEYAGRYTSDELTRDTEFGVVDGALSFGPWGKPLAARLRPVTRDVFLAPGIGFVFERDGRGKVAKVVGVFDGHRAVRWTKR